MKNVHLYLEEYLKNAKSDEDIKNAINKAFDKAENEWYEFAKLAFDKGFPKSAYVGSCALIAIVHNNKLYVANAGDSKGVILRKKADGSYERIKVSTTFNANKKYE
jgi:serine/threonine protein phosphatase PrpC